VLVGNHGCPDLAARLEMAGMEARVIDTHSDLNTDIEYLFVRVSGERYPPVLARAAELDIPTTVVVDVLSTWALAELLLRNPNVEEILEDATLGSLDLERVRGTVAMRTAVGHGFRIGTLLAMPDDPDAYEARRYLSFVSPAMAGFLRELRAALGQMVRPRPPIPWDPTDGHDPVEIVEKSGEPHTQAPYNLSDLVRHAKKPWAREILSAADERRWQPLPPPLLLLGESGTGKSLVARLIHEQLTDAVSDKRLRGCLVPVNTAAMDTRNFDYELFGAAQGTWNEVDYRVGAITQAAYGTVFFDEIGDMPVPAQSRLLTFFNDLAVKIEGARAFFSFTHVRAATNRDLDHLVTSGRFKHDLLARFRCRVTLPPLRKRSADELRRLVDFVAQDPAVNPRSPRHEPGTSRAERLVTHISEDAMSLVLGHRYSEGNFRELEEIIHTGIWRARGANSRTLEPDHLELRPQRFRPDADRRVINVRALPAAPKGAVFVENIDEISRYADLRNCPILRAGGIYAIIDGDLHLRFGPVPEANGHAER